MGGGGAYQFRSAPPPKKNWYDLHDWNKMLHEFRNWATSTRKICTKYRINWNGKKRLISKLHGELNTCKYMYKWRVIKQWMYETCNTMYILCIAKVPFYLNHYRWTIHSEFTFLFISMNPPLVLCENYMYRKIMHAQIKLVRFVYRPLQAL